MDRPRADGVAIKEAGLVSKPVIVCKGVGDFENYIIHDKSGFLVDQHKFTEECIEIISQNFDRAEFLSAMGKSLSQSVFDQFSIQHVIGQYKALNAIK